MKLISTVAVTSAMLVATAMASPGPGTAAPQSRIVSPKDRPYAGTIHLAVDASDIDRKLVLVHEHLDGVTPDLVLLYPQWLPGHHSPEGPIDRLAGLRITSNGAPVTWTRDPLDVFAFHVHAPAGAKALDIEFQYLSPTSAKVGKPELSRDILIMEWNEAILYPAGYFSRQVMVDTSLKLPKGWKSASALEPASIQGDETTFKRTSLETLVDSPLYAGRYAEVLDLDPGSNVPVRLDLFADRQEFLDVKPEQLAAIRALVQQSYRLFGSRHYTHYDFLYSLSDQVEQNGLEHHQSSEDGSDPKVFAEWSKYASARDLLPHEFTHSWNGKFRRPADLWTPNFNVSMQNSLLWVYEGQTQYWGQVLAARSALWTPQQALDQLALTAAFFEAQGGRQWRALQDTTDDPIINRRRPMGWRDWQRFEDYYTEGQMIWLDADTLIREQSGGKRTLDDFAKAFFGVNDGSFSVLTYTFEELVKALNAVQPYDWTGFFRSRLDVNAQPAFLDGIKRGGYRLIYTDTPSDYQKSRDDSRKRVSLMFSLGVEIDAKDATIMTVTWNSAAFKASLTEGTQILAVNGTAYSADVLKDAIVAAKQATAPPIELIVKNGDRFRVVAVDYHGGARYPHLERDSGVPARLDDILRPRT